MRTGITLIAMAMFLMAGQVCGITISDKISKDGQTADQWLAQAQKLAYYAHYDSALVLLNRALLVYEKMRLGNDDVHLNESIVKCYLLLGENYRAKSDVDNTKLYLSMGLDSCEAWLGGEHKLIAEACELGAKLNDNIGDTKSMRIAAERGYALCRKLYRDTDIELARSMHRLGRVEFHTGNFKLSEKYLQQALGLKCIYFKENEMDLARLYSFIGVLYFTRADYEASFDYLLRALNLSLQNVGEKHPYTANCYIGLGNNYFRNSNFKKAMMHYQKAHNILVSLFGEMHHLTINTFTNMALASAAENDISKAIEFHDKARTASLQVYGENSWYGASCIYLGGLYEKSKDYNSALAWYSKGFEVMKKLGFPITGMPEGHYVNLSRVYLVQGDFETCMEYSEKTFNSYKQKPVLNSKMSPHEGFWPYDESFLEALSLRAQCLTQRSQTSHEPLNDLMSGLDLYLIAAKVIEQYRMDFRSSSETSNLRFSKEAHPILANAVATALKIHALTGEPKYKELALNFVQRNKASVFAQSLQKIRAKHFAGIPVEILAKERELQTLMTAMQTELQKMGETKSPDDKEYLAKQAQEFELSLQHESFIRKLETEYPEYYALKYQNPDIAVHDLQQILDDSTALVEYYFADSTCYIFTITMNECSAKKINLTVQQLQQIESFRSAIKTNRKQKCQQFGRDLFKTFVAPIWPLVADKTNLVIFPCEQLYTIPFEAFLLDAGAESTYLIQHCNISYHYSSAIYLQTRKYRRVNEHPPDTTFIAFAPFANRKNFKIPDKNIFSDYLDQAGKFLAKITRDGLTYCELPHSGAEVDGITSLFNRHNLTGIEYRGEQATEASFKKTVGRARYVHLATHSFVNENAPLLSGIAFANTGSSQDSENGILYAGEVYNLDLCSDLVVLSSCESGIGKLIQGEGMMALTRGFLYSGARNVIYSLWKIDDESTHRLMVNLYKELLSGKSYAAALRAAKMKMIMSERDSLPLLWSGFVLIGS